MPLTPRRVGLIPRWVGLIPRRVGLIPRRVGLIPRLGWVVSRSVALYEFRRRIPMVAAWALDWRFCAWYKTVAGDYGRLQNGLKRLAISRRVSQLSPQVQQMANPQRNLASQLPCSRLGTSPAVQRTARRGGAHAWLDGHGV